MIIRTASPADHGTIRDIALRTWPVAYGHILSPDQLAYMLASMYSIGAIREQCDRQGHRYVLALREGIAVGFASFSHDHLHLGHTKLHKLYVLPDAQGSGSGKALLEHVLAAARDAGDRGIELNVNRHNPALGFYKRQGFKLVRDEVIDIGRGYVMDDHVLELPLHPADAGN